MHTKTDRAAIGARIIRFLTAGGLTLALALAQEIARPQHDWAMIATLAAGLIVGLCGGPYRRIAPPGPGAARPMT